MSNGKNAITDTAYVNCGPTPFYKCYLSYYMNCNHWAANNSRASDIWTLVDQNLLMSDEIPGRTWCGGNFLIVNEFTAKMNKNLP